MSKVHRSGQSGQTDYRMTVYPSRVRLGLLVLGSLVFVLGGVFMCYSALAGQDSSYPPGMLVVIGSFAIVFFGACLFYSAVRLVSPTPAVVLDSTGVYDHASATGVGFIAWDDIDSAASVTFGWQRMLSIQLRDPEVMLARASGLKRLALRTNLKLQGTPVNIPQTILPMPVSQLEQEIHHVLINQDTAQVGS